MNKAWFYVISGGFLEIFWVLSLKASQNFTVLPFALLTIVLVSLSFYLFAKGMTSLPSGVAYTVFTGIGAIGTISLGILLLHESVSPAKFIFATTLLVGIIGLKFSSEVAE